MSNLQKAADLKKEMDYYRPLNKEVEQAIMQKFRLEWNFHSNHLEGNSLTFGETKALILFGLTAQGKPLKDHFEITGHDEAIKLVEEVIKNERPLTESFIREIHELLLKEPYQVDAITPEGAPTKKWVNVGQYKITPNHVKTATGEIFRFATPEETPALMHDLMNWFTEKKNNLNPILLASEFHYKFIRIHPFDDGNGRTARILMNFILMQFGYPPVIIKTEDKENYISVLQQADAGIIEPFVDYIAINLIRSLEIMVKGAKGESIEEPDDIDKEISLLDSKLRSVGRKVEKIKSREVLTDFLHGTLKPVIIAFIEASKSFDKFYTKKNYILKSTGSDYDSIPPEDIIETIAVDLRDYTYMIEIKVVYEELNYVGFEKFGSTIFLQISFDRSISKINTVGFSKSIMYTDSLQEEDISQLRKAVKINGKGIIENFIKEKESKI